MTVYSTVDGQKKEKTEDQKLFDKAFELYQDEELDSALLLFRQFQKQFTNSSLLPRVHYNIGYIQQEQGRLTECKEIFLEILQSDYNEKEAGGNGLMGEQYALYKHFSSERLAKIFIDEKNFDEAEKYVRLYDKRYPYEHFCGNELSSYQISRAIDYATVLDGQGKTEEAIKKLLPYIFRNGLADNEALINNLIALLDKRYKTDEIKMELKKSFEIIKIKPSTVKKEEIATIRVFETKIRVYDFDLFDFRRPDYKENFEITGLEKYRKVMSMNRLYKKYSLD